MGVQIKKFSSMMDTDLAEAEVDFLAHINALNVVFRGNPGMMRVQNIIGNSLIANAGLPGSGTNQAIGAFYDQVKQRLIWYNYNSGALHGIYIYNSPTQTVQTLLINGAATDGDILGFTQSNPITSSAIIYQEESDGDILCYIDSLGRPTTINIDRYLNNPYPVTKRLYIDLAKAPPRMPPQVTYENDANVIVNNLLNALYKFRVRWVYDDNQKSVYSTASIVPLPTYVESGVTPTSPTSNSRIRVCMPTGDIDVIKIELWVQQATNEVQNSSWGLVNSFIKADLNIDSNDIYQFLFYNDALYPTGDPEEIGQLFDYVPIQAQALELLNGNTIIMGNITEGYDLTPLNISIATSLVVPPTNVIPGILFFAQQNGVNSYGTGNIEIFLTGVGTNDGSGNPTTLPWTGIVCTVDCALTNGTSKKFSFNASSTTTITQVLTGLLVAAEAQGFTGVTQTSNSLIISQANIVLYYAQATSDGANNPVEGSYAYAWRSAYTFDIAYFDEHGRTPGAENPMSGSINTPEDLTGQTVPSMQLTINNRPPAYAYYYSVLRTPSVTYNKYLDWISDQTFLNIDQATGTQYAYIGYSNMDVYNEDISTATPGGTPVVGYTFQQGDRIRFLQRFDATGAATSLSIINDYQIFSVETNPNINGIIQDGNFIKILYPTADINSNFMFGGDNYQNYKILLYSLVKHPINASTEIFYEDGRMYAIGNPGTANAYHIAPDQTQTANLSQPAIVKFSDGDLFFRERNIPAGIPYYIQVAPCTYSVHGTVTTTMGTTQDQGLIDNTRYQISEQNQRDFPADGPDYTATDELFWNKLTATPVSLRLKGEVSFYATLTVTAYISLLMFNMAGQVTTVYTFLIRNFSAVEQSGESVFTTYNLPFDSVLTIPPNTKCWLAYTNVPIVQGSNFSGNWGGFNLRLQVVNNIATQVMDYSMSDAFSIVASSATRPLDFDENAKQTTYSTLLRWSLADEFGTNINNINRFYDQNQDEVDRSRGAVLRFKARDRILRIFQQRGVGQKGVYNSFVKDSNGENILTVVDQIITINNILYYEGEYGLGNHPESLVSGKIQDYFVDHIRGYECRLSQDGITPISELYKGEYFIRSLFTQYNQPYIYTGNNVGPAFILGCYNYFEEELIRVLQPGTLGGLSIPNYTIAFNEGNNLYTSFYSYAPEWIASGEDNYYTWSGGHLYIHNNSNSTAPYTTFFGTTYNASITTVFNKDLIQKKTWIGITQLASQIWACPLIYTNEFSYGTQQQQSYLVPGCFTYLEGQYNASFQRDTFSAGGWINGYRLKGSWLAVQFSVTQPTSQVWLSEVSVKYIDSPLTAR